MEAYDARDSMDHARWALSTGHSTGPSSHVGGRLWLATLDRRPIQGRSFTAAITTTLPLIRISNVHTTTDSIPYSHCIISLDVTLSPRLFTVLLQLYDYVSCT